MKILIIGLCNEMGGTENYIYNLLKKIKLTLFYFDFLIVDDGKKTPYEDEINKLFNDDNNHFYYCPNLKRHYITGSRWLKNFYDKKAYDLIYMNATTAAKTAYCRYAIDILRTPIVTHSHRSEGKIINHILYKPYTIKHSIYKLACSKNAANWMFKKNDPNVVIIPNGIDTDIFRFNLMQRNIIRKEYNISDEQIIIGHVGRFSKEKNHLFFIILSKMLDDKYIFMCIGDGPLKKHFISNIKEQGLENRFKIISTRKDVYRFYSAMDIFVMPSYNEGLPIVSVEAQCAGLKPIFSDTISKETNISGFCKYLPLSMPDKWIQTIKNMDIKRFDGVDVIKKKGFDMADTALKVEKLFQKINNN